jgi:hypothetical protein
LRWCGSGPSHVRLVLFRSCPAPLSVIDDACHHTRNVGGMMPEAELQTHVISVPLLFLRRHSQRKETPRTSRQRGGEGSSHRINERSRCVQRLVNTASSCYALVPSHQRACQQLVPVSYVMWRAEFRASSWQHDDVADPTTAEGIPRGCSASSTMLNVWSGIRLSVRRYPACRTVLGMAMGAVLLLFPSTWLGRYRYFLPVPTCACHA